MSDKCQFCGGTTEGSSSAVLCSICYNVLPAAFISHKNGTFKHDMSYLNNIKDQFERNLAVVDPSALINLANLELVRKEIDRLLSKPKCDFCGGDIESDRTWSEYCGVCGGCVPCILVDGVKVNNQKLLVCYDDFIRSSRSKTGRPNWDRAREAIVNYPHVKDTEAEDLKKVRHELETKLVEANNTIDKLTQELADKKKNLDTAKKYYKNACAGQTELRDLVAEQKDRNEQLIIQLAGCSTAALGWSTGANLAKRGDYGWSQAYQDVIDLRQKYKNMTESYDLRLKRVIEQNDEIAKLKTENAKLKQQQAELEKSIADWRLKSENLEKDKTSMTATIASLRNEVAGLKWPILDFSYYGFYNYSPYWSKTLPYLFLDKL